MLENDSRMAVMARLIMLGWIQTQADSPATGSGQEDMMAVDLSILRCVKGTKENGY